MKVKVIYEPDTVKFCIRYRLKRGNLFGDYLEIYLKAIL